DRIEALPHRHPGLVVDPVWRQRARRLERRGRQRPQRGLLEREVVADTRLPPGDVAPVIGQVGVGQVPVELGQRAYDRDGDQMAAAETADLALDPALLVGARQAGLAEERVEPVVASQRHEPLVLDAAAASQDTDDRRGEVVVADPPRHPVDTPKWANARTCPSKNASWDWLANAAWNALPEHDRRMTNSHTAVSTPSSQTCSLPKSTSASAPGRWVCGTITCATPPLSSRRTAATYLPTVDSPTLAPCSVTSRCQIRRAVCRCFFGSSRSASTHARISSFHSPSTGACLTGCLRSGGTALASAWRTTRRCTRCLRARARMP